MDMQKLQRYFGILIRFTSVHKPSSENWVLEIRDTKISDEGGFINIILIKLNFQI
jgi:hypothetical protein